MNYGCGNDVNFSPRNRLHRSQRHCTRRAAADLTRDEAEQLEREYQQQQQQQQQQRGDGNSPTALCAPMTTMRVLGGSTSTSNARQRSGSSFPAPSSFSDTAMADGAFPTSPHGVYQLQQHQQQMQMQHHGHSVSPQSTSSASNSRVRYGNNGGAGCDRLSPIPLAASGAVMGDFSDEGQGGGASSGNGANRKDEFLRRKQCDDLLRQQDEHRAYFVPVRNHRGVRRRVGTGSGSGGSALFDEDGGDDGDDEGACGGLAAAGGGAISKSHSREMPPPMPPPYAVHNGAAASSSSDSQHLYMRDLQFPLPRHFFARLGPHAQALLRFVCRGHNTLDEALDSCARLYQVGFETWMHAGKLDDCYEPMSQLSAVQTDALLTFGGFTFAPGGNNAVVPNMANPAAVPTLAAFCDSCEKILQCFSEYQNRAKNRSLQQQRHNDFGSDSNADDDFFDLDGNSGNNNNGGGGGAFAPNNTVDQMQFGTENGSSCNFASFNSIGPFRAWCQYANGFGWRESRDDVPRICTIVRGGSQRQQQLRQLQQMPPHLRQQQALPPLIDVAMFVDAMLTEAGAVTVAGAMGAALIQAHDRYGSGLAMMLRRDRSHEDSNSLAAGYYESGKFAMPRKAGEWHSDEMMPPPTPDNISINNGPPDQQRQQYFASASSGYANDDDSSSGGGGAPERIVPCSSDGETKFADLRNPPRLRAHAVCAVSDTNGPLFTLCFMHVPQGRAVPFDECRTAAFGFAAWLGALTVPNAMQEHFVFLGVPLRVLDQQRHHAAHQRNIDLVREIWSSELSHAGFRRLAVHEGGSSINSGSGNSSNGGSPQQSLSQSMGSFSGSFVGNASPAAGSLSMAGSAVSTPSLQARQHPAPAFGGSISMMNNNNGGGVNRFAATMQSFRGARQQQNEQQQQQQAPPDPNANGGNIVPGWVVFYRGRARYEVDGAPRGIFDVRFG